MKIVLVVWLLLIGGVCAAQTQPGNDPSQSIRRAITLMASGDEAKKHEDFDSALKNYQAAEALLHNLKNRPGIYADLLHNIREILQRQGKSAEAEKFFENRVALLEKTASTSDLTLGLVLFDQLSDHAFFKRMDEAEAAANKAVNFYRKCIATLPAQAKLCDRRLADVQGLMGAALYSVSRWSDCKVWLEPVIRRGDDAVRPGMLIASLLAYSAVLRQENNSTAETYMQRATKLQRDHPTAFEDMGK